MVGISAVVAAMLGLSLLLLTGVLTWRDCLTYPPAWDTLFWFAVLVGEHLIIFFAIFLVYRKCLCLIKAW